MTTFNTKKSPTTLTELIDALKEWREAETNAAKSLLTNVDPAEWNGYKYTIDCALHKVRCLFANFVSNQQTQAEDLTSPKDTWIIVYDYPWQKPEYFSHEVVTSQTYRQRSQSLKCFYINW